MKPLLAAAFFILMNASAKKPVKDVVIVGGGSAGWITAGLLASEFSGPPQEAVRVTLIESPDVNIIGVGEGTWPTMRTTLRSIGISESTFVAECAAAFKQGTRFVGWVDGGPADIYYHPFSAPAGYGTVDVIPHWQKVRNEVSFVDAVSTQGYLCDRNLAPKQEITPEFAHVVNYAYHLDAGKFAELLKRHCTMKLGVRHVLDNVTAVNGRKDGDIESLSTERSGDLAGDLFVDCTGFAALLLGRHYGVSYLDRNDVLFNDSALAVQVPYAADDAPVASQTISTAQSAGWIWDIGLTSRRGVGYTYSSRHTTESDAREALRDYLSRTGGESDVDFSPRSISFRPGHREKFWHRNCVAVGMSAGFLEPLEASALVLVELSARMISEELPANRELMDIAARRFNEKFRYRWDRIVDFLKLHYVLSQRTDSDYWIENRDQKSIPPRLQDLLKLWRFQPPGQRDFDQVDEVFSAASYQYVLYGMGFSTESSMRASVAYNTQKVRQLFTDNGERARELVEKLPDHRALLSRIAEHGLPAYDGA